MHVQIMFNVSRLTYFLTAAVREDRLTVVVGNDRNYTVVTRQEETNQ